MKIHYLINNSFSYVQVNRRQLKERPLNMDPRELLLESIRKPQTLKPVKQGKVVGM
jgi:hypothetical protein